MSGPEAILEFSYLGERFCVLEILGDEAWYLGESGGMPTPPRKFLNVRCSEIASVMSCIIIKNSCCKLYPENYVSIAKTARQAAG